MKKSIIEQISNGFVVNDVSRDIDVSKRAMTYCKDLDAVNKELGRIFEE